MNFLKMCQLARQKSQIPGTGPTTVQNQVGKQADVVQAVKDAWFEIQMVHEKTWEFLKAYSTGGTVAGQTDYTMSDMNLVRPADIRDVVLDGQRIRYERWESLVRRTSHLDDKGRPSYWTITPENKIKLFPEPDDSYDLLFIYVQEPGDLVENTDVPEINSRFHWAIVWRAVMDITIDESDVTLYQKAFEKYDNALSQLENHYLSVPRLGGKTFS